MKKLKSHLKRFNLDDTEIEIYLTLVRCGKLSALEASRKIKIPKSTIYRYLDSLIKKGFVVITQSTRGKKFQALTNIFETKIEEQGRYIKNLKNSARFLGKNLLTLPPKTEKSSSVRVYEGLDKIKQLVWNILDAKNKVYYYTNADRRKLFGDFWMSRYLNEFVRRDLTERGFESYSARNYNRKEYFSIAPGYVERSENKVVKRLELKGEIYIYNDIYAFYTWEGKELIGIEIKNKYLVQSQRAIFEKLWEITK